MSKTNISIKTLNTIIIDRVGAKQWFLYLTTTLIFVFLFSEIIGSIVSGWFSFNRSYSLLIFIISLYMIWLKRDHLLAADIQPNIVFGSIITVIACMMLVVGKVSNTLVVQGLALVISLLGIILLILGNHIFKILFIPVGYLFLMFSILEELLGNISVYFQNITAFIASKLLSLIGMPVLLYQRFIELPHITLEVAKVCNGVNHIVALIALAIPLAITTNRPFWYKICYVFAAAVIGIFANGLRVALIGIWTLYNESTESIHGPFELFYVSFILLFGLGLILTTWFFTKKDINDPVQINDEVKASLVQRHEFEKSYALPVIVLCAIFLVTFGFLKLSTANPVYLESDLKDFPYRVGQWQGSNINDADWPFKNHNADMKLKRVYKSENNKYEMGIYISYFHSQKQGKEIINDQLGWLYNRAKDLKINVASKKINIKVGLPRGLDAQTYKGDERTFYFWYQIGDQTLSDRYKTKIATLLNSLIKRRSNGAMIVVTINDKWNLNQEAHDQATKFIRTFLPIIQSHLKIV